MLIEPAFRTITSRIILENIKSLIIKSEGMSFVERSHLEIINKIYYSYLSNIKLNFLNNKYIKGIGYESFESEWKVFTSNFVKIIEDLVSKPFLLIPFNLEDQIESKYYIILIYRVPCGS